jgi:predicted nuclease of predicted toxin-antitoxin system
MDIRFLLDEDTEEQLATKLQKAGYDAVRVVNVDALGPGSDDTEVRDYARKTGRIIITYDDDLLSLDPDSHPGVFFLTDQRISTYQLFSGIQTKLERYPDKDALPQHVFITSS